MKAQQHRLFRSVCSGYILVGFLHVQQVYFGGVSESVGLLDELFLVGYDKRLHLRKKCTNTYWIEYFQLSGI